MAAASRRRAARSPGSAPFSLSVIAATGWRYVPFLRKHLPAAHALLKPPLRELTVALVGDRRMGELHQRFLDIRGPTDVLTFPLETDSRGRATAGEVVVCVPEARRRAREAGTALQSELLLYALHGLLHLSGFDDRTARGFAAMHRTEDDILTRLGVGPVFAAGRGAPAAGRAGRTHRRGPSGANGPTPRPTRRPTIGGSSPARGPSPRPRPKDLKGPPRPGGTTSAGRVKPGAH